MGFQRNARKNADGIRYDFRSSFAAFRLAVLFEGVLCFFGYYTCLRFGFGDIFSSAVIAVFMLITEIVFCTFLFIENKMAERR